MSNWLNEDYNAVYIGKFQPFHNAHLAMLRYAFEQVKFAPNGRVLVLITDHEESEGYPFSHYEIQDSIIDSLTFEELNRIEFNYINNYPSNQRWFYEVVQVVRHYFDNNKIVLVGNPADDVVGYLDWFTEWCFLSPPKYWNIPTYHGTDIRKIFFTADSYIVGPNWNLLNEMCPSATVEMMRNWRDANYSTWISLVDKMRNSNSD